MQILLVGLFLFFSTLQLEAKDLGVKGHVFKIEEQNLLLVIQKKLSHLQATGELSLHQELISNKIKQNIINPPILPIPQTTHERSFYYQPTFTLNQDLYGQNGKIFARKGTTVKPLEQYKLRKKWIFFNASIAAQLEYVKTNCTSNNYKLILTGGSAIELMQELKLRVYYDQSGFLSEKLGIAQVPAIVEQEGGQLKITEVLLDA